MTGHLTATATGRATKRFLVTQDDDLSAIGSEELDDLGEVDSGAPETLTDFMVWAMTNYPAKKYALIMSDHGAGWMGGWNDDAPDEGSTLSVDEIDQAIGAALAETGVEQLEFMGFDACLMSQVEALSGIAPYARYAVASEEVEPAMGWAYSKFLGQLADKPKQSGADLAKSIVESYIVDDVRIQDDEARSEYVAQAYGVTEEVSAAGGWRGSQQRCDADGGRLEAAARLHDGTQRLCLRPDQRRSYGGGPGTRVCAVV